GHSDVLAEDGALGLGDELTQLLGLLVADLVLDAGVEVLVVLANDHDVGFREAGAHALVGLAGAQARVEVELLAQGDVDGAETGANGSGDGTLDGEAALLDRIEHAVGQRSALRLVYVGAGILEVPLELHARALEHTPGGL